MKTVEKRVSFVRVLKEQASVKHKTTKDSLHDALYRLKKGLLQFLMCDIPCILCM